MLEEKALMQKANYNWQGSNVALDPKDIYIMLSYREDLTELEKNYYKLFQITLGTPIV